MAREFTVSATIPAAPKQVYDAWLSSKGHTQMTEAGAKVSARVGGSFTAWDGYSIFGIAVGRKHTLKWLFPQEKATFNALRNSTCIPKMLFISGKNLKLKPSKQIVQSWHTTEFASADLDSQIEVLLVKSRGGTKLALHHTNIPAGQSDYRSGWRECYFEPMKKYFKAQANPA
jgi:uncharacterized protein YndB with AHSA1/START domain